MEVFQDHNTESRPTEASWIRGVNLGGWLVLEPYITPYFFALTTCHLKGDYRFYEGQIDAPSKENPMYKSMDISKCKPILPYPNDDWTLTKSFPSKDIARGWMETHWDNFVKRDDISKLKKSGITHIRVPIGHWIMGDIREDEPWIDGGWGYFVRLLKWCREENIQVWPDIHTAPGSQNGLDSSGKVLPSPTCSHWSNDTEHVERSLKVVQDLTTAIDTMGLVDVISGIGVLNDPFLDCDKHVIETFYDRSLQIVRRNLGENTAVFIGDLFNATQWNNGWWTDRNKYKNTYLDSHYFHVHNKNLRQLSPRQHIAYVCQQNHRDTVSCCYDESDRRMNSEDTKILNANRAPSQGISRMIGQWSASFDTDVSEALQTVMNSIATHGIAPDMNRQISQKRKQFLQNFVKAQMVTYESAHTAGVSRSWFYWTLKTEGGTFAEWDFLRGISEGWIPSIPAPHIASAELYGSCYDILFEAEDDVKEISFVRKNKKTRQSSSNSKYEYTYDYHWQDIVITDDIVTSHGSLLSKNNDGDWIDPKVIQEQRSLESSSFGTFFICFMFVTLYYTIYYWTTNHKICNSDKKKRQSYEPISDAKEKIMNNKSIDQFFI